MTRKQTMSESPAQTGCNPYTSIERLSWPLTPKAKPYIMPVPEDFVGKTTGINFRAPLALEATLEEHCRILRVNKSEWLREAVEKYLETEQFKLWGYK